MRRFVNVAVLGAGGAVGQHILKILGERGFPLNDVKLLGTSRSSGQVFAVAGRRLEVGLATPESFDGVDVAFFAATTTASAELAPVATARGAVVIDKSSYFRMHPDVPLVVPEVNGDALRGHHGIVASPNCSTIQLVMVLKPIHDRAGLARVVVTSMQSVSGTGREALVELDEQAREVLDGKPARPAVYPHQIAFNVLPHIDAFAPNGYTGEEMKLILETRKILGLPDLRVTATTTRVPVRIGHAESVNLELTRPLTPSEAREVLARAPGVAVIDDPAGNRYPMPVDCAGKDEVFVGRIRDDESATNGLALWIVADNLRKGAATNAIQIAEELIARDLLGRRASTGRP